MKLVKFYIGMVFIVLSLAASGCGWIKYPLNPVLRPGSVGSWDADDVEHPTVIKDGEIYKMWYAGLKDEAEAIGYATSTDGISWVKDASNPVLEAVQAETWGDEKISEPAVIKDGDIYKLWYTGFTEPGDFGGSIGYATSTDGINWINYERNPVLKAGELDAWDAGGVRQPTVIKDGNTYKMWYAGVMDPDLTGGEDDPYAVGYATSKDGINWTKSTTNPVFEPLAAGWDSEAICDPIVIKDDSTYRLWYCGIGAAKEAFGYAISTDGINWTRQGSKPVMTMGPVGTWDSSELFAPHVIKDGDTYKMWYCGEAETNIDSRGIGYATMYDDVDLKFKS